LSAALAFVAVGPGDDLEVVAARIVEALPNLQPGCLDHVASYPRLDMDDPRIEPVVSHLQVPPGMLGRDQASIEVRCFVVVGPTGVILVDAGPPGSAEAIGIALGRVGAAWSDVTDIVLTHHHFDHVGGLAESTGLASEATVWAGADDASEIPFEGPGGVRRLAEGDRVGDLHVLHTWAHARSCQPPA
jgi:hypothetical protein